MFDKIKSMLNNGRLKSINHVDNSGNPLDGYPPSFFCPNLPSCNTPSYDNTFANITRIAEAFAEVMPYAIDESGRKLKKQPRMVEALYNPNSEMSISDFLETLIVMLLVHPMAFILCWHYENGELKPGGPITKDNIAGFTFLENVSVSRVAGTTTYYAGTNQWSKADVITLSLNVNPYNLLNGYSPSQAIKKWATVDDYIAEYQAGTFRNGAVPAGEMIITAPTVDEYNKTVDMLQKHHRGASNAGNIVYSHRPTSSIDGKPMTAGIEWVPFAQSNKDMTLDSLFNQSNKKIDMGFGVPEEVKGYLQNSNYASAEVADYVFSRRVVYPKLVKVYSKLTHELNRVSGGRMGFALSFDYEPPVLNDTRKIQAETLQILLGQGFTVESSVEALQLPRSFLKLEEKASIQDDEELQVTENSGELPTQTEDTSTEKSVHVHECDHGCEHSTKAINPEDINSTLRNLIGVYLLFTINLVTTNMNAGVTDMRAAIETAIEKAMDELEDSESANELRKLITADLYYLMSVNEARKSAQYAQELKIDMPITTLTDDQRNSFGNSINTATSMAMLNNTQNNLIGSNILEFMSLMEENLKKYNLKNFVLDLEGGSSYTEQMDTLLRSFGKQALETVRKKSEDVQSQTELESVIQQTISQYEYKQNRWAGSEQHRAEEAGNLLSASESASESEKILSSAEGADYVKITPMKTWQAHMDSDRTCMDCRAANGKRVKVDEPFADGNMVPHMHANCRCVMKITFDEEIVRTTKICCPSCGRYMMETTGGVMKNVICANSKCKKHFDFEVNNGEIIHNERSK